MRNRWGIALATVGLILGSIGLIVASTTRVRTDEHSIYSLQYSRASNWSDPVMLEGATVSGKTYPFAAPDVNVDTVEFYLDGVYVRTENNPPFDFAGGSARRADAWDTTSVPDGQHTIEARLLLNDGSTTTVSATFTVANTQGSPDPDPVPPDEEEPPDGGTYGLQYSLAPNESDPVALEGATVSGSIYAFTAPDAGVSYVDFYLDGVYVGGDQSAPFDIGGSSELDAGSSTMTTSEGEQTTEANSWDTTSVPNGEHTVEALLLLDSGAIAAASATFTVTNSEDNPEPPPPDEGTYSLQYSLSKDRSNPAVLDGATVSGVIYAFLTPDMDVEDVEYFLNGERVQVEHNSPYDFAGGSDSAANAWDTTTVANAEYTITARLLLADGSTTSLSATFTVANAASEPAPDPEDPAATDPPNVSGIHLVPSFRSVSVYVPYSGSADALVVEWRRAGGSWRQGHPLYVDHGGGEARGSLVGLSPSTAYEVRVGEKVATVATRSEASPVSDGAVIKVSDAGEFQAALDAANPGETISLAPGTYVGPFTMTRSGTPEDAITIKGDGSGEVILSGNRGAVETVLALDGADYVRVAGLTIRDAGGSLVLVVNSSDHVWIEDCRLIEPGYRATDGDYFAGAVHLRHGSSNTVIRDNLIHRETPMTTKLSISGIITWKAGEGAIIEGNTFTGGFEDAVRFGPEDSTSESKSIDVDIYGNRIDGACFDDGIQPEGVGINVRVWENEISGCFVSIALAPIIEGPAYVFRNVFHDSVHAERGGTGIFKLGDEDDGRRGPKYIYHNTIYANSPVSEVTVFKQSNAGLGAVISRNNIVYASRYVAEVGCDETCDFDYDALYTTDGGRYVEFRSTRYYSADDWCEGAGQECHGIDHNAASDFANAANGDFRLVSGSPLVDAGVLLPGFNDAASAWTYRGSAPDIGATEQ